MHKEQLRFMLDFARLCINHYAKSTLPRTFAEELIYLMGLEVLGD